MCGHLIKDMITTKIIFDRRKTSKKKQPGAIEIRITENRKSYYIATGISVLSSQWVAGQVVNRVDASEVNKRLALIYQKVMDEVNICIESGHFNIDTIKKNVWALAESGPYFIDWIEGQIDMLRISEGTRKHYRPLVVRLVEFGCITNWQDLTVEKIYAFDAWLHKNNLSDAGVYNYHKCLKALLTRAVEFCRLERNPYDRLKGKFKRGEKESVEYLTEDEMLRFESLILPYGSPLETAHDLFVFQMYTGLPYSDMMAFDISDYKWDGTRWNRIGERIKTGVPYVSSILAPALHILEKHDMKIPHMNNADYNRHLKALGLMAGIKTKLHSHLARHTFATYMLRNGVKIENVSKMLGHTNITQTQRYAKVLAQSVHEDFDMIAKKMEKGTSDVPKVAK